MSRPYELIVFDWDGTLMDSETKIVRCFSAAAAGAGVPDPGPAAIRDIIGLGLREAVDRLFPALDSGRHAQIVEGYRRYFLELDDTEMDFFPGVAEGLARLSRSGFRLAVATGKARRGLDRLLQETGLAHLFDATRCADEARSKPHPQMLEDILADTGVVADRAIMVGDTVYDMQMAKSAGVDCLAVGYGVHEPRRLLAYAPRACLGSFAEVCDWFC